MEELVENEKEMEETLAALGAASVRVWNVLRSTHLENRPGWAGHASEIQIAIPLAVVVANDRPTRVPGAVRSDYPIVLALDPGKSYLLVRAWSVLGIGAAVSAALVVAGLGVGGVRSAARRRRGCCVWCGYSLVGIAGDAPCPECGSKRE